MAAPLLWGRAGGSHLAAVATSLLLAAPLASRALAPPAVAATSEETASRLPAATPARPRFAGRPLAEVLRQLQDGGLAVVFTTELVRPDLVVRDEPRASEPRALLAELLAPHGLVVQGGPGGMLVVVADGSRQRPGAIAGSVRALGGAGLAGATVRVVESDRLVVAGPDGSFLLGGLAPGRYTLEASAQGYLEQRVADLGLAPGRLRRVELRLHPQPEFGEQIVVQPSQLSLLRERADSSFALGREEIESLPHLGDDVFRAASLLPGTAANDVSAQVSVHGGRSDEVRVLLDGQELYQPFHLTDYDNALSIVPARNLAGATLTTGAFPASHGDRMSGVLDLRTTIPAAGRHLLLSLSVLDALLASHGSFADGRGSWLLSGRRGSLDLAADAIGADDPLFWDLFAKGELETPSGRYAARLLTARDELTVRKADEESFEVLANEYRSSYGWVTHQHAGARLLVESSLSWAQLRRLRGGVGSETDGEFTLRDHRDVRVWSGEQSWSLRLGEQLPRWGLEARRYDARFDYTKRLEDATIVRAPFAAPRLLVHDFAGDLRGEHLGVWVSDRFPLGPRGSAELGLRYDRHPATGDTLWSPRANFAWRLGERAVARLAWGRFHQSQRPYELQVEDGEQELARAELSEHWVAGWETLLTPGRLGVEAVRMELFRREVTHPRVRYENLLEPVNVFQEIEPDRVRIDPERALSQGVELLLRGRRGSRFDWWLAYAYARSEDRLAGSWVPRAFDQPHTLTVDLGWRLPRQWQLNLAWRYHTGWPRTPVRGELVVDPEDPEGEPELAAVFGPLRSERFPAYHRLDLRASRGWDVRGGRLTLFVDVQNLYDRRNLAGFDVEIDDEEGELLLESERWPGMFPSIGLSWEL